MLTLTYLKDFSSQFFQNVPCDTDEVQLIMLLISYEYFFALLANTRILNPGLYRQKKRSLLMEFIFPDFRNWAGNINDRKHVEGISFTF